MASTDLAILVQENDLEQLREVVTSKIEDANKRPRIIYDPMRVELGRICKLAVTLRMPNVIECLINSGMSPSQPKLSEWEVPFTQYAVESNADDMVSVFIKHGFHFEDTYSKSLDITMEGMPCTPFRYSTTLLHAAAFNGNAKILRMLLKLKLVDVNTIQEFDSDSPPPIGYDYGNITIEQTPLYVAILQHSYQCVTLLLDFGADPNIRSTRTPVSSPLQVAVSYDCLNIARVLVEKGAIKAGRQTPDGQLDERAKLLISALNNKNLAMVKLIEKELEKCGFDIVSNNDCPMLALAVTRTNGWAVDYLVSKGCDLHYMNDSDQTLLMMAASSVGFGFDVSIITSLLAYEECRQTLNDEDLDCHTVVTYIARNSYAVENATAALTALVAAGAKINDATMNDEMPLWRVVGCWRAFKFLVEFGVKLNSHVLGGDLLFGAAMRIDSKYLDILLEYNMDITMLRNETLGLLDGMYDDTQYFPDDYDQSDVKFFPSVLGNNLRNAMVLFDSGCNIDGFRSFMTTDYAIILHHDDEEFRKATHALKSSGREGQPLSLLEQSRQVILRCLGNGNRTTTRARISELQLSQILADIVEPYIYKLKPDHWVEREYSPPSSVLSY